MSTPSDDRLLLALFEAASERPADEQPAFLDRACAERPDIRRLVEAMLADAVPTEALWPEGSPGGDGVGRQVGPYTVTARIGEGGMGAVYRAEHEALGRPVALKVVRGGHWAPDARLRRLAREPRLLARLDHPHIARVLDAGATPEGLPYFAMEYVDGEPIDAYCDARRLGVRERLALFRDVCGAVHHAHQHLTVHRDLKPSNILVTPEGQVKLLDFGIAKLLAAAEDGAAEDEAAPLTETGDRVLTPEYASPEQVRGEPVTTASDIYALGAVLYELLAGRRPYAFDRATPSEVERVVSGQAPPPLPTAADGDGVAARRGTTADALRRALRGDLDRIVQTALHKEPERRYASAQALAEDIERYLDGLPVRAQRDTLGYRARTFAGRHARALAAAGAVLAVVVGALAWYTVRLGQARDRAEAALARSEQVTALVVDLFSGADPEQGRGEALTVRQALDESLARLRQPSRETPPDVQASLLDAAGRIYTRLGLFDDARPLLRQAQAIRRGLPGDHRAEIAASLFSQAELANSESAFPRADTLYREALRLQRAALGVGHPATRGTMGQLAYNDLQLGRELRAERLGRELLRATREAVAPRSPELVVPLRALTHAVLQNRGDTEEAGRLLREVVAIQRASLPPDHPDVIPTLHAQAVLADYEQAYERAVAFRERARDVARAAYGPDHPLYADALDGLVQPYYNADRLQDAVAAARTAVDARRAAGEERSWGLANSMHNLACVLALSAAYDEAEQFFRRSRQIWVDLEGPQSEIVANSLGQEGFLLWDARGDLPRAEGRLREALAIARARAAEDPDNNGEGVADHLRNLAYVLSSQRKWREVEQAQREVLAHVRRTSGPESRPYAEALRNVGQALIEQGRHAEAEPLLRRALPVFQRLDDQEGQQSVEELLSTVAGGTRERAAR